MDCDVKTHLFIGACNKSFKGDIVLDGLDRLSISPEFTGKCSVSNMQTDLFCESTVVQFIVGINMKLLDIPVPIEVGIN